MSGRLPELPASARAGTKLSPTGTPGHTRDGQGSKQSRPSTSARGRKKDKQPRPLTYKEWKEEYEIFQAKKKSELRRQYGIGSTPIKRVDNSFDIIFHEAFNAAKAVYKSENPPPKPETSRDGSPLPRDRIVYDRS